jgi:hypothetical protein
MGLLLVPWALVWLATGGDNTWLSQRLQPFDLEVHEFPDTGRGLRTTRERVPGEIVMAIDNAITCDTILERYSPIRRLVKAAAAKSERATSSHQKMTQEQVLALGLLEMMGCGEDDFHAYAQTLPTEKISVMTLPKSLQQCLPRCYSDSIDASKSTVQSLYNQVLTCNASLLKDTNSAWTPPDFDDFLWAFGTVRSRSVSADELPPNPLVTTASETTTMMLLPGLDLLNHQSGVDVSLEYLSDTKTWQLSTQQAYKKDQEVYLNYGERDNLKMLFTYGFCAMPPENGPNDNIALFDLTDLLQASSAARPTIFTPAIIPRIEPQLVTAVGGNVGEQRAMFSLEDDGPRESLLQGMGMMQQVAQQLPGSSADDDITINILTKLKEQRQMELIQGLQKLQSPDLAVPKGWQGVKASIGILLQAEWDLLNDATK